MENWRDKLGKAKQLMEEIKAIQANEEATEEDRAKIPGMLEDAKALKADAGKLREVEMTAAELETEMRELEKEAGAHQAADPLPGGSEFKAWPDFLAATWLAMHPNPDMRVLDPRLKRFKEVEKKGGHETKQMVESVGASGGFLVPTEYLAQLQNVIAEEGIVRNRATIIRMRRRQIDIPVLDQTGTTAGRPHWFGGMIFYWAAEASEKTITTAAFRKVTLTAHKLIGYTRASDELVDDAAISLSDFLAGPVGFAGGVAWHEDYTFLQGTGAGQPLGVINAGATITVNRTAANNIYYGDLVNMMESFLPSARGVWVANQSTMSNLMTMQDQAGGAANTGTYVWGSAADGVPARLLGLPIIFTEKLPRIGTAGDILLADFRYYLLGDRQATTISTTEYDQWALDQTSWRVVHRVDGQPWLSTPLTYQDGTTQVSPFVILGDVS